MLKIILKPWASSSQTGMNDLSNDALYVFVDQEAAKILEVKVRG